MPRPPERGGAVSEQMLNLYKRGLRLIALGFGKPGDPRPQHRAFVEIDKKLCWSLIGIVTISVFDSEIDLDPPDYMQHDSAMCADWRQMQQWKQRLEAALEARRKP
ncbi:hypothetical protein [Bradyrhizobium pachyrhizi]|uniref:hypothetical protein n=1 Tax=Bradyrhizobium pachyrhizi TaxID=280333 RepID=UPI003D361420